MAHIHDKIDFTASAYIVHQNKVLLVHHKKLGIWLQIGGHIELDETTDEALLREIKEECGLEVEILSRKVEGQDSLGLQMLYIPDGMNVHNYNETHRHVDHVYFARAKSSQAVLEEDGANDIRWFSEDELDDPQYDLQPAVKYYARQAIKRAAL
jgi:ADP-ribose pyrophosphatase YjhB (NUDIX family)